MLEAVLEVVLEVVQEVKAAELMADQELALPEPMVLEAAVLEVVRVIVTLVVMVEMALLF